jgi:hypothetical protein
MAGQEIEGDVWDQSLGLDLLPPIACAGFRTLSLASVQNLGSRDPHLTKLALNQALCSCKWTHVSCMTAIQLQLDGSHTKLP